MKPLVSPGSLRPDEGVRSGMQYVQVISLTFVLLLGVPALAGWVIPPLGNIMPHAVFLMRANTSLLVVLCGLSAGLSIARSSPLAVRVSQALGVFVTVFALLILLKDFSLIHFPIETLLAPDSESFFPAKSRLRRPAPSSSWGSRSPGCAPARVSSLDSPTHLRCFSYSR